MDSLSVLHISRWSIYLEHEQPIDGFVYDQLNGSITRKFQRISGAGFVGSLNQAIGIIGCLLASEEHNSPDQMDLVRVCQMIECLCISPMVDEAAFSPCVLTTGQVVQELIGSESDDIPF